MLPFFLTYLGAYVAIVGFFLAFFPYAETVVNDDVKKDLSAWLTKTGPIPGRENWANPILATFDALFGKRLFSKRRIIGSILASLLSVLVTTSVWAVIRFDQALVYFVNISFNGFIAFFSVTILWNGIADYVSLAESRFVIGKLEKKVTFWRSITILIIDFLATTLTFFATIIVLVFVIGGFLGLVFGEYNFQEDLDTVGTIFSMVLNHGVRLDSESSQLSIGVFFYSTFQTSVWVWAYMLTGFTVRSFGNAGFLNVEERPLTSLGLVLIATTTVLFIIAWPFLSP